jgi:hypothetical protein
LLVGLQSRSILTRLTYDINRCFHATTGGVGHSQAQFAAVALAKNGSGTKKEKRCNSLDQGWAPVNYSLQAVFRQ